MQSFTQNLASYLQTTRAENMQAHLVNHVHIRQVEKKVDEMSEWMGCLAGGVALVILMVLALLILIILF